MQWLHFSLSLAITNCKTMIGPKRATSSPLKPSKVSPILSLPSVFLLFLHTNKLHLMIALFLLSIQHNRIILTPTPHLSGHLLNFSRDAFLAIAQELFSSPLSISQPRRSQPSAENWADMDRECLKVPAPRQASFERERETKFSRTIHNNAPQCPLLLNAELAMVTTNRGLCDYCTQWCRVPALLKAPSTTTTKPVTASMFVLLVRFLFRALPFIYFLLLLQSVAIFYLKCF